MIHYFIDPIQLDIPPTSPQDILLSWLPHTADDEIPRLVSALRSNLPAHCRQHGAVTLRRIYQTAVRHLERYFKIEFVDLPDNAKLVVLFNQNGTLAQKGINPMSATETVVPVVHVEPATPVAPGTPTPAPRFTVALGSGENDSQLRSHANGICTLLAEHLLPTVQKHIRIWNPHQYRESNRSKPGEFHVMFFSSGSQDPTGSIATGRLCWGFQQGCGDSLSEVSPWTEGIPVTTSEGNEIAAFDANTLYIYCDLPHHFISNDARILKKICEEVAAAWPKLATFKEEVKARAKQFYITSCSRRVLARHEECQRKLAELRDRVQRHQEDLTKALREHRFTMLSIPNIESDTKQIKEKLAVEFDAMLALDKVKGVSFRDNKLVVLTDELYFTDPRSNKQHVLGEMKIILCPDTAMIVFNNMSRRVNGHERNMHGPHIFATGRPCLGNMDEVIPNLLATYEWSAAVQMAIIYLESVNVDDSAGRLCNNWPLRVIKPPAPPVEEAPATAAVAAQAPATAAAGAEMFANLPPIESFPSPSYHNGVREDLQWTRIHAGSNRLLASHPPLTEDVELRVIDCVLRRLHSLTDNWLRPLCPGLFDAIKTRIALIIGRFGGDPSVAMLAFDAAVPAPYDLFGPPNSLRLAYLRATIGCDALILALESGLEQVCERDTGMFIWSKIYTELMNLPAVGDMVPATTWQSQYEEGRTGEEDGDGEGEGDEEADAGSSQVWTHDHRRDIFGAYAVTVSGLPGRISFPNPEAGRNAWQSIASTVFDHMIGMNLRENTRHFANGVAYFLTSTGDTPAPGMQERVTEILADEVCSWILDGGVSREQFVTNCRNNRLSARDFAVAAIAAFAVIGVPFSSEAIGAIAGALSEYSGMDVTQLNPSTFAVTVTGTTTAV